MAYKGNGSRKSFHKGTDQPLASYRKMNAKGKLTMQIDKISLKYLQHRVTQKKNVTQFKGDNNVQKSKNFEI